MSVLKEQMAVHRHVQTQLEATPVSVSLVIV